MALGTRSILIDVVQQYPNAHKLVITPVLTGADQQTLLPTPHIFTLSNSGNIILPDGTDTGNNLIDLPVKSSGTIQYDWEIYAKPLTAANNEPIASSSFYLSAGSQLNFADLVAAGGEATDTILDYIDSAFENHEYGSIPFIMSDGETEEIDLTSVHQIPFFLSTGVSADINLV